MRALVCFLVVLSAATASAHDLEFTHTVLVLRSDGTYRVDLTCDLDAVALGVPPGADSAEVVRQLNELAPDVLEERVEHTRRFMLEHAVVRFDGVAVSPDVELPEYGHIENPPVPTLLGLSARLSGPIPAGARSVTLQVAAIFPAVYLTVLDEGGSNVSHLVLTRGAESDPFPVAPGLAPEPSRLTVASRYFRLGVWHIVPEGLDHILFVLGLFLLSAHLRPLLFQVTTFTLAHTVTLALASYGVVRLPPSIVEPLIALSIAYVGIENVRTAELSRFRPLVVFVFGLLHGLGFAGVLGALGLPENELLVGLVSFNLGVEAGQLLVIAGAFATFGWFRSKSWYRSRVTVPVSLVIAAVGLYWAVERALSV